jgi:hypothetical protein
MLHRFHIPLVLGALLLNAPVLASSYRYELSGSQALSFAGADLRIHIHAPEFVKLGVHCVSKETGVVISVPLKIVRTDAIQPVISRGLQNGCSFTVKTAFPGNTIVVEVMRDL